MKILFSFSLIFLISTLYSNTKAQYFAPPALTASGQQNGLTAEMMGDPELPQRFFSYEEWSERIEELMEAYSSNKSFQDEALLPSLIALAYYPELHDVKVRFVYKDIKTSLAARPGIRNLFRKRKNRVYTIFIDNKVENGEGVLFEDFPLNAQVGGMGHEYAHIIDYSERSALNILWLGIRYFLSDKSKAKLEHEVDKITIERGLGWQTLAWEKFIIERSQASDKYKNYKSGLYLSSEDIIQHMEQCPVYEHTH
ncbi:MAG: hypothetical protein ACLFUB_05290 [Cyclobacteriaceae bacterium]